MALQFQPSTNCYAVQSAPKVAFVIDGQAYYRALFEAFSRARRTIFIVGWDLHSDLQLVRGNEKDNGPTRLGEFLNHLAGQNKALHVYLLSWDFSMIYALEREFFPRYKFKWRTHRRIHFCLDGHHPIGASQHQKIVVIDDSVAFAGGLDLSKWRWDTPDHASDDPRRVDPDKKPYPPFHDVQMAVSGPAAHTLGRIVRDRWVRAGGEKPVDPQPHPASAAWPASLVPDLENIPVAIALTFPEYEDQPAVREVEQLYLDSIDMARTYIYIENQYLTSYRIGEALTRRLEENDGPEIVIVMPFKTGGWLEQHTMDVLRGRILNKLRHADRHDRLRVYYPRIAKDPFTAVMVHAKIMVVDDGLARVGSANLSNRSMGLDSECDLAVAANDDETLRTAITHFRNRLIAEHLGVTPNDISRAVAHYGSLIKAMDELRQGERTLVDLSGHVPQKVDKWVPDSALLDPEKPVAPQELLDYMVPREQQPSAYRHILKIMLLIGGVLALGAVWRWTPAGEWLDMQSAKAVGQWIRQQPFTPVLVVLAYVLGGMVAFPVTLMVVATVVVFGPWWGAVYVLAGSQASALAVFWVGRWLGRDAVHRFAGTLFNRLSRKLSDSGLMAVITFRIVPVAPFSVINLIAGVSGIHPRDYILGTLIGMLPGMMATVVLADRLAASLSQPDWVNVATLGGLIVLAIIAITALRRWSKQKRTSASDSDAETSL